MTTMLEAPITIQYLEPDTQFVNPAAIVWSNASHITCNKDGLLAEPLKPDQGSKATTNSPSSPELKPHVGLNRQRRGSKLQSHKEGLTPERARYLERNRVAANKCRLKKKQECEKIQHILDRETTKRETLLAEAKELKEEVWQLKNMVFAHARCGDEQINRQLTKMTQNVLKSSSLQCSALSRPEEKDLDLSIASPSLVHDTVTCAEFFDDSYIDLPDV
ncbi:hypothetical protein PENANT_c025G10678 [Penicillium antarcticum]|uniref:BZIP domain-containing protein n=1 Tax=Penicillium antarcticum TaxID=416450 RepID=A0A1V6PXU1_9EURO|nr:uncharacterized protein N7508_000334 [Penicillium antarcticum]KAJ5320051.1 hypothetical protein N7508_000334 [Penicillium antarcticum]OQD81824.1 hypothetical protein PENANT_c025G10678 [Penicillium antarcticum]